MSPRPVAAIICAVGVLSSAWAVGALFASAWWVRPALVLTAGIVLTGVVARRLATHAWQVVIAQLLALVLILAQFFPARPGRPSTLFLGVVPTPSTGAAWLDLLSQAVASLRTNIAPAPVVAGTAFLLAAALALLVLVADALAVTLEMPAIAGLPMLTPFLTAVANGDGSLPVQYFLLPTLAWLLLLAETDHDWIARWVHGGAPSADHRHQGVPGAVLARRWGGALGVGSAALALALLIPVIVPTLPTQYLLGGWGNASRGSGQVGYSPNIDLSVDLQSTSQTAVLRYTTDDPEPPPLRVGVSSRFEDGRWIPDRVDATPSRSPGLPAVGGAVPSATRKINVLETRLEEPFLAAPYPLTHGTVTNAQWAVDGETGVAVTDRTPSSYSLDYLEVRPSHRQLAAARVDGNGLSRSYTRVDMQSRRALEPYVDWFDAGSSYDTAMEIQSWLRTEGEFTYSLQLEPPPAGMGRLDAQRTALARFLESKRGYCVQYATTMVLLARMKGIPARMVTGFLPGRVENGTYTVLASDAHAWPELYFNDIGWIRFEPTPGQRSDEPPPYARPTDQASPTPTATAQGPTASSTGRQDSERDDLPLDEEEASAEDGSGGALSRLPALLLVLLAVFSVVPLASRLELRRRLAGADDAERVERQWEHLRSQLADLGVDPPDVLTVDEQRRYIVERGLLEGDAASALQRISSTVTLARYAPDRPLPDLTAETRTVRRAVARSRTYGELARAVLLPRSGIAALRGPLGRVTRR